MRIMSWKRIFRTARKVGAPVIIADENGKKPQVILPLDIYEALIDEDQGFEMMDDSDFGFDEELPQGIEFDDDFDDISEIEFDEGLDTPAEWGSVKGSEPDERAAPAFEFEDSLESDDLLPMDIPQLDGAETVGAEQEQKEDMKEKSSKSSEEIAVEDRFYFEPIDDETEKD